MDERSNNKAIESAKKLRDTISSERPYAQKLDPAILISLAIERDISERVCLKEAWDGISRETRRQIRSVWLEIAKQVICLEIMKSK